MILFGSSGYLSRCGFFFDLFGHGKLVKNIKGDLKHRLRRRLSLSGAGSSRFGYRLIVIHMEGSSYHGFVSRGLDRHHPPGLFVTVEVNVCHGRTVVKCAVFNLVKAFG